MAKYKIEFIEVKTAASGNKYARTTISNEAGEMKENVAIFGTFPGFETLMTGHTIEAELAEKDYNGSKSYSLVAPRPAGGSKGGAPNIKVAQERKAEFIKQAQERKSESIAYFNAINSAIALVQILKPVDQEIKPFLREWRDWFLKEWESYNDEPFHN